MSKMQDIEIGYLNADNEFVPCRVAYAVDMGDSTYQDQFGDRCHEDEVIELESDDRPVEACGKLVLIEINDEDYDPTPPEKPVEAPKDVIGRITRAA